MADTTRGFAGATATPTPDDLFDYWLPRPTGPELRALLYLIRRTLGFRKHADTVSLRQFMEGVRAPDGRVFDEGCGFGIARRSPARWKDCSSAGWWSGSAD